MKKNLLKKISVFLSAVMVMTSVNFGAAMTEVNAEQTKKLAISVNDVHVTYDADTVYDKSEVKSVLDNENAVIDAVSGNAVSENSYSVTKLMAAQEIVSINEAGTYTVWVKGDGAAYDSAEVSGNFIVDKAEQKLFVKGANASMKDNESFTLSVSGEEAPEITFTSSDKSVLTVSANGLVKAVGEGTASIKISAAATRNYKAIERTFSVKVVSSKPVTPPAGDDDKKDDPVVEDKKDTPVVEDKKDPVVEDKKDETPAPLKKGTAETVSTSKVVVTSSSTKNPTVQYTGTTKKTAKTVTIPKTVKIDGVTYKVTSVAKNAFKNNKKIKKVTLSSNIKTVGKNAFYGCTNLETLVIGANVSSIDSNAFKNCKKLKKITVLTTKLTTKNVANKAFSSVSSKATITVPAKKYKAYKSLFVKKGLSKKATIKKAK